MKRPKVVQQAAAAPSPVAPPVTIQSLQSPGIDEQRRTALRRAQARRGFAASRRAGETFSGSSYMSSVGQRSLLGVS